MWAACSAPPGSASRSSMTQARCSRRTRPSASLSPGGCAPMPASGYVTATEFCPWEAKGRVMRVLLDSHRDQALDLVDGIKVFVDDGFVLVRPDPDEPAYHIVASVGDESHGQSLVSEYARQVREAQQGNGLHPVSERSAEGDLISP